jgi:hypothetical protein
MQYLLTYDSLTTGKLTEGPRVDADASGGDDWQFFGPRNGHFIGENNSNFSKSPANFTEFMAKYVAKKKLFF